MIEKKIKSYDWLDWCRFIGIYFVVLGHLFTPIDLQNWIYSFHMPLFFAISGLLYNVDKYRNFKDLFVKKTKQLLLPYLFFNILSYILWLIKEFIEKSPNLDYFGVFAKIFYLEPVPYNLPLWFLPALFIVEIIAYFFIRYEIVLIGAVLSFLIGLGTNYIDRLPFFIDIAFSVTSFYLITYYLRKIILSIDKLSLRATLFIFISLIIISVSLTNINGRIDISSNQFGFNYFIYWINAVCGISSMFIFSQFCSYMFHELRFVKYISRNTIVILALHIPVITSIKVVANMLGYGYLFSNNLLFSIIISILIVIILMPVIYIINKFIPMLIGR